jgi:hypothetical protein
MPMKGVSRKWGESADRAQEIAARTVNKKRRKTGRKSRSRSRSGIRSPL